MKRRVSRPEMQGKILDATDRLLARYGYRKMTIDDLAREVGRSRDPFRKWIRIGLRGKPVGDAQARQRLMEWHLCGGRIGSYRDLMQTSAQVVRDFGLIQEEVVRLAN